jgi:hypothetical protein
VLAGELHGFEVLDRQVVVVDAIHRERELRRLGRTPLPFHSVEPPLLRFLLVNDLLAEDPLKPAARGLDRPLVDVAADPTAPELLGHGRRGAGADETVEHQVARV